MSEMVEREEKFSVVISEISSKIPAEGITLEYFLFFLQIDLKLMLIFIFLIIDFKFIH